VHRYFPGDYFGERALLRNENRAATCTTTKPSDCLYLKSRAFNLLLGPLDDIFRDREGGYKAGARRGPKGRRKQRRDDEKEDGGEIISQMRTDIEFNSLRVIGTLGRGR
jgi:hypothetical protein